MGWRGGDGRPRRDTPWLHREGPRSHWNERGGARSRGNRGGIARRRGFRRARRNDCAATNARRRDSREGHAATEGKGNRRSGSLRGEPLFDVRPALSRRITQEGVGHRDVCRTGGFSIVILFCSELFVAPHDIVTAP